MYTCNGRKPIIGKWEFMVRREKIKEDQSIRTASREFLSREFSNREFSSREFPSRESVTRGFVKIELIKPYAEAL